MGSGTDADLRVPLFLGRVLDSDGDPVGTCFQVAPGVLVTAWHVLTDVGVVRPGDVVRVDRLAGGGSPFTAAVHAVDELRDLAVLTADADLGGSVPGLVPTDAVGLRVEVEVTGVSRVEDAHSYRFLTTTGTWQGSTTRDEQVPLGRVGADAVLPGMSGAPVLRSSDRMVLGVVSGRYNTDDGWLPHTAWVARTETLLRLLDGVAAPAVQLPAAGQPTDVVLSVDDTTVCLSGPGWRISAGHQGIRPELVAAVDDVRRARARMSAALRDPDPAARTAEVVPGTVVPAVPSSRSPESDGGQLALGRAGVLLAESFLPDPVRTALTGVMAAARAGHQPVRLGVQAAGSLARLPWEALPSPDGSGPLALNPQVALYRRIPQGAVTAPTAGPLRIMVAIAAPRAAGQSVLNYEHELRTVLSAVRSARQADAQVRIVPFATCEAIRAELTAAPVHVLHLSGHGTPGLLHLENAAGGVDTIDADGFVDRAIPPGRMPPVIALSACYTDVAAAADTPSFAARLCERGASAVVATETSISDGYATHVFARFYGHLAETATPEVVSALAEARRAVEQELAQAEAVRRGRRTVAAHEWAALTVLSGGATVHPVDPDVPARPAAWQARRRVPGLIARDVGEFVGRRAELRTWPGQLAAADTAGLVIHGIGGIGKTTLANELAVRYADARRSVVTAGHVGPASVDSLLTTVTGALRTTLIGAGAGTTQSPLYSALGYCAADDVPWQDRMTTLRDHVLPQLPPLLLILDNFEDNLTDGPNRTVADPDLAALLADWTQDPGTTRLLITCRYRFALPDGADSTLTFHQATPLSLAETGKLLWALPNLDRLRPEQAEQVWRLLGGHPRSLEYLDALLAAGHGRFPDITARLTRAVRNRLGTDAVDGWLAATAHLDAALAETVTLAADDVLLTDLLTALQRTPGALELLAGAAVYREPIDINALLFQIGTPDESAATLPDRAATRQAIETILEAAGIPTDEGPVNILALPEPLIRALKPYLTALDALPTPPFRLPENIDTALEACVDSSLLTFLPESSGKPDRIFVHRWTADELARHPAVAGQDPRSHTAAAAYWEWRAEVWPQDGAADIHDLLEARHHLLRTGDTAEAAEAAELSEVVIALLDARGAWDQATAVARDTLTRLPTGSALHGRCMGSLGDLSEKRGDHQQAEVLYRQALATFEALAAAAPDDLGHQRDLSISYSRLAGLAEDVGQTEQAETLHRQALTINEALAATAPDNPDYQRDLAIGYENVANQASRSGQAEQAETLHRRALSIREALAATAPDNVSYQRDLSVGYGKLADLAFSAGQIEQAETLHRQALAIRKTLAAETPDNPQHQRDLAYTYIRLAELARGTGHVEQAQALHHAALTINETLVAAASDNLEFQRSLAVSFERLGSLSAEAGQNPDAAEWYHRALAIRHPLQRQNPAHVALAEELASCLGLLAQVQDDDTQARQEVAAVLAPFAEADLLTAKGAFLQAWARNALPEGSRPTA